MFFDTKEEWMGALDKHWSRIGLGLPLTSQLKTAAAAFYVVCASRLRFISTTVVSQNVSRALKPAEALKQARLRQLAWVTTTLGGTPREITSRNDPRSRPPKGADPTKMKPDLPGFTPQEAFLLTVAVSAESCPATTPSSCTRRAKAIRNISKRSGET